MNDPELAKSQFIQLCEQHQKNIPLLWNSIIKKSTLFRFSSLPQEVTKYFYTTNIVESFNSILEKSRQRMGGFFQSEDCLKVNVFLTLRRLHENKWQKGVPHIIAQLYSLRQLFAQ